MRYIIVGSRVPSDVVGITLLSFDPQTGEVAFVNSFGDILHPAYQCWDPQRRILYSVAERKDGAVVGWHIDPSLTFMQTFKAASLGSGPCHLALSDDGKALSVSNYGGGSISLIALEEGLLSNYFEQYEGSGPVEERQEASHVHSSLFADGSSALLVADLGADKIHYYRNSMQLHDVIDAPPGSGPRHMALSRDERYLFVAAELSSEVLVYRMGKNPSLVQQISTLPVGFSEHNTVSHIHISEDGTFLYVGNRGHDSLAVFGIKDGWLSRVGHSFTERTPWNFAFSDDERFVIVANTDSDSVTVYPRDQESGLLAPLVSRIGVDRPSCITLI
ncbi:MAG: lactonase family protein [Sphaerochaeta sp.]|jgi:6-phosphogluconolactonase|nr:lactonase family protein [Spirochaetales bacterium]